MVLVLMLSMAGCTTFNNFRDTFFNDGVDTQGSAKIKIGIYEPMSGEFSKQGKQEVAGIELAHELYPSVLDHEIELIYEDNKSNMYDAETAIQDLASKQPNVILGSYGEVLTLIASDYVSANSIPAITISSTNPLITENNPYFFTASYAEERAGEALADYAVRNGRELAAVVKIQKDDTTSATIKRFKNRMIKLTGNKEAVLGTYLITQEATDYTEAINLLKESGATATLLALPAEIAENFMTQAKALGIDNMIYLGRRSWNTDSIKKMAVEGKIDIAFPSDQSETVETEMSGIFMKAYHEKYGEEAVPSSYEALGFDAYLIAIEGIAIAHDTGLNMTEEEAMELAGSDAEGKAMIEELQKTRESGIPSGKLIKNAITNLGRFNGATGTFHFDGENEATKTVSVLSYRMGQEMPAYVVN